MIRRLKLAGAILLLGLAGLGAGCARPFPSDQVPRMKILIMDFDLAPGLRETTRAVRGWWLGARTIYQNPRAGTMFAERLTSNLAIYPFVNLFSRLDLKYYFARKRQSLRAVYNYLSDAEIEDLMRQVSALDFARELGADKVLSGRVVENFLSENRTIHIWASSAHVECRITDVLTGRVEWEKEYRLRVWFASQFSVQEEIARRVADDLREEYFRPLIGGSPNSGRSLTVGGLELSLANP